MEYIGKRILRYGDREFIGDEYSLEIPEDLFHKLLKVASIEELNAIKQDKVRLEHYETADLVQQEIDERMVKM